MSGRGMITLTDRVLDLLAKSGRPMKLAELQGTLGRHVSASQATRCWEMDHRTKVRRGRGKQPPRDVVAMGRKRTITSLVANLAWRGKLRRVGPSTYDLVVKLRLVG